MKQFTESHEWVDEQGRVGVTSFARQELGEVVSIELPQVGAVVKGGEPLCVIESTKAAADIYAPVSGRVVEVNEALKRDLSLLNKSPEEGGWLVRIEVRGTEKLLSLLEYRKLIGSK